MGTFALNAQKLIGAIDAAVLRAQERTSNSMLEYAKKAAPVRKVFDKRFGKRANDLFPTFRFRDISTGKITSLKGDFRQTFRERGTGAFKLVNERAEGFLRAEGRRSLARGLNVEKRNRETGDFRNTGGGVDPVTGRLGGRLRREIALIPSFKASPTRRVAGIISPTPYAIHQEFGTRHHASQPFMRPALHHNERMYVANLKAELASAHNVKRGGRRPSFQLDDPAKVAQFIRFLEGGDQ